MSSILKTYKSSYFNMAAFFCLCCMLCTGNCFSQAVTPYINTISTQIEKYGLKQQTPVLFVHFDKTVYSNNENVWFTAYLINDLKENDNTTLLVNLIKDDSRKVVLDDKFVMQKGLAFGNMFIPDSIGAGNYTFVVYTNVIEQGKPRVIFKQPVTIKTSSQQTFTALLSPVDTAITSEIRKVRLMANTSVIEAAANMQVNYYVGNPSVHILSGTVKTDEVGQYIFNIPSKILSEGNNKLYVRIKYNKEEKVVSMALPVAKQAPIVNFYPEGGNLVHNLQTFVGWETKTAGGVPLKATAILYRDDKPIDTIETDGYGMGKFLMNPQGASRYYVKLYKSETKYALPEILAAGPTLTARHSLANDTLSVTLFDNKPEKLFLLIHNYKQVFAAMPITMNDKPKSVKVLLNDVPKGIAQLTVTDSLGRPFIQRTFFAHYNRRTTLQINTSLPEYATRKKINVKMKLNSAIDTMALVSIACVQDNRVEIKKKNDIESYFYLKNELGEMPLKENYIAAGDADKQFLENVLLIKGWSRYKWTDVLRVQSADTVHQFETYAFKGKVNSLGNKPLKKPVTIILMGDGRIVPFQTDSTGNIVFKNEDMLTEPDKKLTAMVSGDNPDKYKIQMTDPYSAITEKIPALLTYKDYTTAAQQNSAEMELAGNQKAIQLKEVKIVDKKDEGFYGTAGGTNACGDYVCKFNILNCPNHRFDMDNHPPIAGQMYQTNGRMMTYAGCTVPKKSDYTITFKGIYNAVEFYPSDYSQLSPSLPDYVSTIYWKHLAQINSKGETEFSFYTSDITGRFKIIVQGVTNNDVVYGEKTFNVVKAK